MRSWRLRKRTPPSAGPSPSVQFNRAIANLQNKMILSYAERRNLCQQHNFDKIHDFKAIQFSNGGALRGRFYGKLLRYSRTSYLQSIAGPRNDRIKRRHEINTDREPRDEPRDNDERKRPL